MAPKSWLLLKSKADAEEVCLEINQYLGVSWDHPVKNAFDERFVLMWSEEQLLPLAHLLQKRKILSRDECLKAGFPVGFHGGPFFLAAQKLEEAEAISNIVPIALEGLSFSALSSLIHGFFGQIYSFEEAIERSCTRLGQTYLRWWKAERKRLYRDNFFKDLMIAHQREKHGEARCVFVSNLKVFSGRFAGPLKISGEGAYQVIDEGTPHVRRRFVPATLSGEMTVRFTADHVILFGEQFAPTDLIAILAKIHSVCFSILVEARVRFDPAYQSP
jgi:hypothetical protein